MKGFLDKTLSCTVLWSGFTRNMGSAFKQPCRDQELGMGEQRFGHNPITAVTSWGFHWSVHGQNCLLCNQIKYIVIRLVHFCACQD